MGNRKSFLAGMAAGTVLTGLALMVLRKMGQEALYELNADGSGDDAYEDEDEFFDEDYDDIELDEDACNDEGAVDMVEEDQELASGVAPVMDGSVNMDEVFAGVLQDKDGFF